MDFKVGDEVRIKPGGNSTYARNNPGEVSKVKNIKQGSLTSKIINLESSGASGVWDYEVELVVPANVSYGIPASMSSMNHQWKVGDNAIVKQHNHNAVHYGDIVEIVAASTAFGDPMIKRLSDGVHTYIEVKYLEPAGAGVVSVNAAVNTKVALPPGYTVSNTVWHNFYPSDAWVSEYEDKPAKPAIACECGQRTAAKNAQEDDPQFHQTWCPVYKSKEKK